MIDLIFLIDIALNFRTSYRSYGIRVTKRDYPDFRQSSEDHPFREDGKMSALIMDGVTL
jgi:hypothetical protein